MIRAHYAAFEALVVAGGVISYDSESPNAATGGYATHYPDNGNREPIDLADDNPMRVWTVTTICNGDTLEQAQLVDEKVEAAVEGVRPAVAGRNCTRIKRIASRPAQRDDDADPARFYAVGVWRWYSTRAI